VSILRTLDDKIDGNRRLSELLEETAATVFRARFVEFVGVEKFDDSDIGPVPSGWVTRKIGEWGRVVTGATPSTKDPENFDGPYPFITIGDLREQAGVVTSARTLSERGAASVAGRLLPPDAVMMSCIATIGECGLTTKSSFTNQQINAVVCDDPTDARFLYFAFKNLRRELESHGGGGSVYTNVSRARFAAIATVCPPRDSLKRFDEIAAPVVQMSTDLAHERLTLTALRDALLPALVSGHIRVPDSHDPEEVIGPVAEQLTAGRP
jgi:type I restriction enzyme S subunit